MKRMKASLWMLSVTAVAVAAMLMVPQWVRGGLPTERAARARICQVTMGQIERVLAVTGVVRYESEYAAISPVTGVVSRVYVAPGDHVKAGEPLFRLDGTAQEAAVAAALSTKGSYAALYGAAPASVDLTAMEQAAEQHVSTAAEEAALLLRNMTVRASADGLVQQVNVSENGGILAGSPAVSLSGDRQSIQCSVVIRDAERLQTGLRARLVKDGKTLAMATLTSIGAAQTSASTGQTVSEVRLVPDENLTLPLGASIEAEIILYSQADVPTLPVEAVTEQGTVWWIAEGRGYETPVQVLMADEVNCWVNLPVDTQVAYGGDMPSEGQKVKEMKP